MPGLPSPVVAWAAGVLATIIYMRPPPRTSPLWGRLRLRRKFRHCDQAVFKRDAYAWTRGRHSIFRLIICGLITEARLAGDIVDAVASLPKTGRTSAWSYHRPLEA